MASWARRGAYLLENRNGECGGLASTRLGLRNDVVPLYDGDNGSLLNGRRALETGLFSAPLAIADLEKHSPVGIDTTEELRLEFHIVKAGWEDEISGHVARLC